MSSDDTKKQFPTEDKLDSLIRLVHQLSDRIQNIDSRLESLEQKVDARLQETRLIWEGVLARLENLEISVDKVQAIVYETRAELRELKRELKEHLPAMK